MWLFFGGIWFNKLELDFEFRLKLSQIHLFKVIMNVDTFDFSPYQVIIIQTKYYKQSYSFKEHIP